MNYCYRLGEDCFSKRTRKIKKEKKLENGQGDLCTKKKGFDAHRAEENGDFHVHYHCLYYIFIKFSSSFLFGKSFQHHLCSNKIPKKCSPKHCKVLASPSEVYSIFD